MFTKVAMWAVFIFLLGLFGFILINTFGVITTTNQQDYTLIKNAVEAAMNDSIDWASYRAGFYLCPKGENGDGQKVFYSKNDYEIVLNSSITCTVRSCNEETKKPINCDGPLVGEFKINKDVFTESFIRRFANNINNNKSYQVTIKEVIEYPPKVSVRIDTFNTYNSVESRTEEFDYDPNNYYGYDIRNQIDAILEEKS